MTEVEKENTGQPLKTTPLNALHRELGGRMVAFAGYDMPVQFPDGILAEHRWVRENAGLFDVSHMGQLQLTGGTVEDRALALEGLMPIDVAGLAEGRQRYGFLTNDTGGILDDLMVANRGDHLFIVVNAACKASDLAHLRAGMPSGGLSIDMIENRALLALQGPKAESVLSDLVPQFAEMKFMDVATLVLDQTELWVSRSGYTGEDGFEISVPATQAEAFARRLLEHDAVRPIGLGARDSLRLEGGLCLYGHDIDTSTTPVEAGLTWAIGKARRPGGAREGGYPGAGVIARQLAEGADRKRVGLSPEGRAPMREGVKLFANEDDASPVGQITSGGFGPTVGAPVAMGYVPAALSAPGTRVFGDLRGRRVPVEVVRLPFVAAGFKR